MLPEILRFLCYKDVFNKYSPYSIRELVATDKAAQAIYDTIKELHDDGGTNNLSIEELGLLSGDKLPNSEWAKRDLDIFLKQMAAVKREAYTEAAIKKTFEVAHKRNVAAYLAASALPCLNNSDELNIADILKKLEDSSNVLSQNDNIGDYTTHTENGTKPARTIPTYLTPLDEAIDGGLSPGQLGTYVGWPGIGKTLLLHQSAAMAFYHGYHAALVTLEISRGEACRRLDMFFGRPKNPEKFKEIINAAKDRNGRLTILDAADEVFTPASVRSFLESQRRRETRVDVLFIDYADLMETGRRLEDYNELGEIYKELRRIANKFDVPIWTASQAVRGAFTKRWLGMADIADSFKKARIADLIVTINQDDNESERGEIRLHVAKSRRNKGHPKLFLATDMDRMAIVQKNASAENASA